MKKCLVALFLVLLTGCVSPYSAEDLPYLKGKSVSQIKSAFGQPHVIRKEANATLWSYYQDECSSLVFFDKTDTVQYAELRGKCSKTFAKK